MLFITKYNIAIRWRLGLVKNLLKLNTHDIVLDAGCGEGFIPYIISRKVKKVVGADIGKEVIQDNQDFADDKLSFITLDLNNLSDEFEHDYFDKIICTEVLEHAYGFENIIRNIGEVLKKGGVFIATIPVYEDHGHFEHNDFDYLRKFFSDEGFQVVILEYIDMPFFTRIIYKLTEFLRRITGFGTKEGDLYDDSLAFELRMKPSLLFYLYKLFFPVLFLITLLDTQPYVKGEDWILLKLVKK